jgi:hypothetical protein
MDPYYYIDTNIESQLFPLKSGVLSANKPEIQNPLMMAMGMLRI